MLSHFINCCEMADYIVPAEQPALDGSQKKHKLVLKFYTRSPTCFPPPGLSRSFVESLMTVVPRLYRALARPRSSSSRSPCTPDGGGDWDERGESGAGID